MIYVSYLGCITTRSGRDVCFAAGQQGTTAHARHTYSCVSDYPVLLRVMFTDSTRKIASQESGYNGQSQRQAAAQDMAGPSPRDMGQQLALQLLAAFGNSPNPDSDAAEALAHAQLWLCNMRKAVRESSGMNRVSTVHGSLVTVKRLWVP